MPGTVLIHSGVPSNQRSSLHTMPIPSARHSRRLRAANTAHALPLAHMLQCAPHVLISQCTAPIRSVTRSPFRPRISCCSALRRSTNGRASGIAVSAVATRPAFCTGACMRRLSRTTKSSSRSWSSSASVYASSGALFAAARGRERQGAQPSPQPHLRVRAARARRASRGPLSTSSRNHESKRRDPRQRRDCTRHTSPLSWSSLD
jgi:hypothetical protein